MVTGPAHQFYRQTSIPVVFFNTGFFLSLPKKPDLSNMF